jgi:protein-disulfide isomerase/uncharacterized membrane protein/peroxiredoxin
MDAPDTNGPGRLWGIAVAILSMVGLAVAAYLTNLHLALFYGKELGGALCDFSASFNCSAVNGSAESEIAGIPQSVLAVPAYAVALALGLAGAFQRDRRFAEALTGLGVLTVLYSAYLAWVSATVIGAWCLFCMVLYAVNLGLLGLGVWGSALRPRALATAVTTLPVRAPGLAVGALVFAGLALGGTWSAYSRIRTVMAQEAAAAALAKPPTVAPSPQQAAADRKQLQVAVAKEIQAPADAPVRGAKHAKVAIVELSDFQCPYCKRLAGILRQLLGEYPDDVSLAYVHFPMNQDCTTLELKKTLHPEACAAAAAATCAGEQGKFWEMHDRLFEVQGSLGTGTYDKLARELGLDTQAFGRCLADPDTIAHIKADSAVGVAAGASGTPAFYVNGRVMAGAQPIEVLRAVVDAELAGNKAALHLDVEIGTEVTAPVDGSKQTVAIASLPAVAIDAFEASLDGPKAVSHAGVEPARSVSWFEAKAACEASGKRLCTEKEWDAACTGHPPADDDHNGRYDDEELTGRKYGYAGERLEGACADARDPRAPRELLTGNHPKCGTPEGVYDLVGGVKEWVGLTPATSAAKGGSYASGESARCGYVRDDLAPDWKDTQTGFRCCGGPPDPPPPAPNTGRDVGERLAELDIPANDGTTFHTASLAGRPAILTFWASWCGPCQKEMPALAALVDKYKQIRILGVSVDTDDDQLAAWLTAHPMPFSILRDPGGKLMDTFTNRGLPTTFWIKRDGTIRLRTTGIPPGAERRIDELAHELVSG